MESNQSGNIVYILINEAMPGYTKIGITDNLEQRIRSLDRTNTPLPFECYYAARVQDSALVEGKLHDAFGDHRVRSNREFFRVSPERIRAALSLAEIEDVTPRQDVVETEEDERALEEARRRRATFNFEMVGIKPGAVLNFVRDDAVTATVHDNRLINFRGEVTTLSDAALQVFKMLGYNWKAVFWPETLDV